MRDLSRKLDPFTLNAPRTLVAAIALLVVSAGTGRMPALRGISPHALFLMVTSMAVGGGIGDSLYVLSMARIGVSRAYPIASVHPALTLLLAVLLLGESETVDAALVGGMILVIAGVILVSRPPDGEQGAVTAATHRQGVTFSLLAALCWAAASVMLSPATQGADALLVTTVRLVALTVILWAVVGARRTAGTLRGLTRREWVTMIAGGLVGWALGSLLFVMAIAELGAARAAILTSTSPLFALPMTALLMDERPSRAVLVGTAVTVAGVALVS